MIDFPIPLGERSGFIRVPADLTSDRFGMVEAMFNAVKVFAEANTERLKVTGQEIDS